MNTPKILFFICLCFFAFKIEAQMCDTLNVPTQIIVEDQMSSLTSNLNLNANQLKLIYKLLEDKTLGAIDNDAYQDRLFAILTFSQKDRYLSLLQQDVKNTHETNNEVSLKSRSSVVADKTVTFNYSDIIDVRLVENQHPDGSHSKNTNYSNHKKIAMQAWTYKGKNMYNRNLIKFPLESIPVGSEIVSATFYLYSDPAVTSSGASNGNSKQSGSNAFYIERASSSWSETGVTWNNAPLAYSDGRKLVGASSSTTENLQIDLKDMVQYWVNAPIMNHGALLRLQTQVRYRSRHYCSTEFPTVSLRPRLVIKYNDKKTKSIEYVYDNAGNRKTRQVVVISRSSLKSSDWQTDELPQSFDSFETADPGLKLPSGYRVFPNPTAGNLKISFRGDTDVTVRYEVHSLTGEKKLNGVITSGITNVVPMERLNAGIYILSINYNGECTTYKIIKQ